jgi:hypothetical protein
MEAIALHEDAARVVGRARGGDVVGEADVPRRRAREGEVDRVVLARGPDVDGTRGVARGGLDHPAGSSEPDVPGREVGRLGVEVDLDVDVRGRIPRGAEEDMNRRLRGRNDRRRRRREGSRRRWGSGAAEDGQEEEGPQCSHPSSSRTAGATTARVVRDSWRVAAVSLWYERGTRLPLRMLPKQRLSASVDADLIEAAEAALLEAASTA